MKQKPDRRPRGGFTLVEITVAMGILAVIMLGMAATAGISARGAVLSRQRIRATYLATQMLETLCNGNITDTILTAYDGDDTSDNTTYATDPNSQTGAWGSAIRTQLQDSSYGTIAVAPLDAASDAITKKYRATVIVVWFNRGQQYQVQLMGVK